MSRAAREAIWAKEKLEGPKPRPTFGTRVSYTGKVHERKPSGWCVVKVHTDGRRRVVRGGLEWQHADVAAGRMRDGMSEADVDAGWNYIAEKRQTEHSRRAKGDATFDPSYVKARKQGAGGFPQRPAERQEVGGAASVRRGGETGRPLRSHFKAP